MNCSLVDVVACGVSIWGYLLTHWCVVFFVLVVVPSSYVVLLVIVVGTLVVITVDVA